MPFYRFGSGFMHIKFGGKARKNPPAQCVAPLELNGKVVRCCAMSTFLCDHELEDGKTCDAPLCEEHATAIEPDRHLCPRHLLQLEAPKAT